MKIGILLFVSLIAFATVSSVSIDVLKSKSKSIYTIRARTEPLQLEISHEGIFHNIGRAAKDGIKRLIQDVKNSIIRRTKDILTDGLHLHPPAAVKQALNEAAPSKEGIFGSLGKFVLKKAAEIAGHLIENGVSHEGIVSDFGLTNAITNAEELFHAQYNSTLNYGGPSHEGILGNIGGIVIKGLGHALAGHFGPDITKEGDIFGRLFFIPPKYPLIVREDLIEDPSKEGIFSNVGKLIGRGLGKLTKQILHGSFNSLKNSLDKVFLARGQFGRYPSIRAPANEIILRGRHHIHADDDKKPEVKQCVIAAEEHFSHLFDVYDEKIQECVVFGNENGLDTVDVVKDIILDAVKKVEDVHRETAICFEKKLEQNRIVCLDKDIPRLIEQYRNEIKLYSKELSSIVDDFSRVNTDFDNCLVEHLGYVQHAVHEIVHEYQQCVDSIENKKE